MKSPEHTQIMTADEIWQTVHTDPNYSVYSYPKALGLFVYDTRISCETGVLPIQEADVVIAAADLLITEHAKNRSTVQGNRSSRRVPF